MKKADRRKLERRTKYRVEKSKLGMGDNYEVRRFVDGELEDLYYVTVKWDLEKEPHYPVVIWCDCTGFKCQKFAHMDHKHVKLVIDYQKRGEPEHSLYRIYGTAGNTKIEHIGHEHE